jgi:uncharacterized cysteine cluster protein YcgN (CxxCxxCC family)
VPYEYDLERPWLFTDEGQRAFLKARDTANRLCDLAGACTIEKVMEGAACSSNWRQLACVDRLIEIGEFRCVYKDAPTQYQVLQRA